MIAGTVLALLVAAVAWRATGGRWMTVETGSMGTAAPVGTLVVTRPTPAAEVRPGDIVSFRTPTGQVFTHRAVAVRDGVITTQGDNNGSPDPYHTTDATLVGRVSVAIPWLGWVLRALPLVLCGAAAIWAVARMLPRHWRTPARLGGNSVLVALTLAYLSPFVGFQSVSHSNVGGGARATIVSTGVFPTEISAERGNSVVLQAGQLGELRSAHPGPRGRIDMTASPHLTGWWWPGVVATCALPLLVGLVLARRQEPAS